MNRVDAARSSGSSPPWMIPKRAWSGRCGPPVTAPPSGGSVRSRRPPRVGRGRVDRLVEGDRDVRSQRLLHGDCELRRNRRSNRRDASERSRRRRRHAQITERRRPGTHPSRSGSAVPVHEPMQPAEPLDPLVTRPQVQVVRVAQDDRGADVLKSSGASALTVAFVPTGMNCGVSTTPWVSVSRPARARVDAIRRGRDVDVEARRRRDVRSDHASGAAGSSQSEGIPGSTRRGGGIS